jgi:hypothetical protein
VFLPGLADVGALELGSKLIGERAYTETTASWDTYGAPSSSQTATSFRPLVPVDALRQLRAGRGLVVYGNRRPVRVRLRPFFKPAERRHRERAEQRVRRRSDRGARHALFGTRAVGRARRAVRGGGRA